MGRKQDKNNMIFRFEAPDQNMTIHTTELDDIRSHEFSYTKTPTVHLQFSNVSLD